MQISNKKPKIFYSLKQEEPWNQQSIENMDK